MSPAPEASVATGAESRTAVATISCAVTALFVPGNRPERFTKAVASGADAVIIDLEDAVAAGDKVEARREAMAALSSGTRGKVRALVRPNASGTAEYDGDVQALLDLAFQQGHGLLGIMVPKAEDPEQLAELAAKLPGGVPLVALVETALGLVNAVDLARVTGVARLAFGAIDFALDIDSDSGDRFLDHARSQLVLASRAGGVASPLDAPITSIHDAGSVTESARVGRSFGFGGKLCIHPAQLAAVMHAYRPSVEQIEWARRVLAVEGGAAQVDGEMVDRPVTDRARRILQRASQRPTGQD